MNPGVLILNDTNAFAGTEQYIFSLATALAGMGQDVQVACPGDTPLCERLTAVNIPVHHCRPASFNYSALLEVRRLLRSGQIALLHVNNGRTALFGVLAITLAGRGRCVMTQHFLRPRHLSDQGFKAIVSRWAHRWVNRRISRVIAISNAVSVQAINRGEIKPGQVQVIPNGINEPDRSKLIDPLIVRQRSNIAPTTPLILCAARLEEEKSIGTLIDAMKLLGKNHPNAICLIAGAGQLHEALQARIEENQLQETVRLLGFRADLNSLLNACDLFVLPSRAEPFGLVLIEAMACGKPVIAVNAGGPVEIIVHEKTGLLVPPEDAAALALAMEKLMSSTAHRQEMGQNSYRRYKSHFTAIQMAKSTQAIYNDVVGECSPIATMTLTGQQSAAGVTN